MLQEDIAARLRIALTTTIVEEYSLLMTSPQLMPPSERTFAAQLAFRLRHVLENDWHVDVDYNSWPAPGERRAGARTSPIPGTACIVVHRRGKTGRDNNLFLLELKMQDTPHHEDEVQRLFELMNAHEYGHAALLNLHHAYTAACAEPPVVLLPTWGWIGPETKYSDVYAEDVALAVCRRGHQRFTALNEATEQVSRRESRSLDVPVDHETGRTEILPQLKLRYGDWIRGDISGAALVHHGESVLLESVRHRYTKFDDCTVKVDDLSPYLNPSDPIELNVARLLKWDDMTMIMVTNVIDGGIAGMIAEANITEDEDTDSN